MNAGRVVFSLDFELGWGHRLTRPSYVDSLRSEGNQIRRRVKDLIDLFERYDIPATWAVVGNLVKSGGDDVFHAPDLFEYLLNAEVEHEIGLHSFAHKPYDKLSPSAAREDLNNGIDALQEWEQRPEAFVFPENRIRHLEILQEKEFECYRGTHPTFLSSFPRGMVTPETFDVFATQHPPVRIPSSLFLAARRPRTYRRWYALRGLTRAMTEGELVHYWFHPHNVVTDRSLLSEMEMLFKETRSADDKKEIQIQTMSQAASDYIT